jgi:hypothetical protein
MPYTIHYRFSQHFSVSALSAYAWCTDYTPDDHALMGNKNALREVTRLAESIVLLKESIPAGNGIIEKQKLVHLYPDWFSWVSTHLTGPNKFSQFTYRITAEGSDASHLDFSALHLEHQQSMTQNGIQPLTAELCKSDSDMWKLLAKAMEKELNK